MVIALPSAFTNLLLNYAAHIPQPTFLVTDTSSGLKQPAQNNRREIVLTTTGQSDRTAIRLVHPLIPAGKGSRGTGVFSGVHKVKGQKPSGQTLFSAPEGNLELCFSVY